MQLFLLLRAALALASVAGWAPVPRVRPLAAVRASVEPARSSERDSDASTSWSQNSCSHATCFAMLSTSALEGGSDAFSHRLFKLATFACSKDELAASCAASLAAASSVGNRKTLARSFEQLVPQLKTPTLVAAVHTVSS